MKANHRIRTLIVGYLAMTMIFLAMFINRFFIQAAASDGIISYTSAKYSAERENTMEGIFYSIEGAQLTWPTEPGVPGILNELQSESYAFLLGNENYGSLRYGMDHLLYRPDDEGNGPQVHMTVSSILQNYAYQYILAGREGSVIVADNKTGKILCLASHSDESLPPFSLADEDNSFLSQSMEINGSQYIRGVFEQDPPGSTFKIITAAAALEDDDLDSDVFYYQDDGELIPPGNTYQVHNYNYNVFGDLDLPTAFMYSSNTYFAHLALETGWNSMQKTAEAFGLNKSFDIPFLATVRSSFNRGNRSPAELAMIGFGQGGLAVTPMNLVLIGEAIANNGTANSPYLIENIFHPGKSHLYRNEPRTLIDNDISDQTYSVLKDCLKQTAEYYGLPEGTYAKTGTAECLQTSSEGIIERIHTYILVFTDRYSFCISMNDSTSSSQLVDPACWLIEQINYVYDQELNK